MLKVNKKTKTIIAIILAVSMMLLTMIPVAALQRDTKSDSQTINGSTHTVRGYLYDSSKYSFGADTSSTHSAVYLFAGVELSGNGAYDAKSSYTQNSTWAYSPMANAQNATYASGWHDATYRYNNIGYILRCDTSYNIP